MIISEPKLLIDKAKCKRNIIKMQKKAQKHHLIFRPHFKTHQSAKVAEIFRELGVEKCTVSSV
ncbi:MAG: alanine racemase, partial [Candidatus Cloacimonetes bacterium]|nr:alanine racemase [Candidatus Cloacimonadota bacterium]